MKQVYRTLVILLLSLVVRFDNAISAEESENFTETVQPELQVLHLYKCLGSSIGDFVHLSERYFFEQTEIAVQFETKDPDCTNQLMQESVEAYNTTEEALFDQAHTLYSNGWLLKNYNSNHQESIPPNRYCIVSLKDNNEFRVKYCAADCKSQTCISKCCLMDEVCNLEKDDSDCVCEPAGTRRWNPQSIHSKASFSYVHQLCTDHHGVYFKRNRDSATLTVSSHAHIRLLEDGTVKLFRDFDGQWITVTKAGGEFCVDGAMQNSSNSEDGESKFSGEASDMILRWCKKNDPKPPQDGEFVVQRILIPCAIVILVPTIFIYVMIWSEQTVHGYTVFFHLVTLLALYVFIVLSSIPSIAHPRKHPTLCSFIAGGIHFFYLSCMCWLTAVSFDLWRQFRRMDGSTPRTRGKRRFVMFLLLAFGYPILHVFVCAMLDSIYRDAPKDTMILPRYGVKTCHMSSNGITYFLYIPVAILLSMNIGFFIVTIFTMTKYKKSIREAFGGISKDAKSCAKVDNSFGIYARLFIIMGIFWTLQIICWFAVGGRKNKNLEVLVAITDALTILQAVAIFYIFVCKKTVFDNLWKLQPWLRPVLSLGIRGRCCAEPPPDIRKFSNQVSSLKQLRVQKESAENQQNRISRDSITIPKASCDCEDDSRKISVGSTTTEVSDLGDVEGKRISLELRVGSGDPFPAETTL